MSNFAALCSAHGYGLVSYANSAVTIENGGGSSMQKTSTAMRHTQLLRGVHSVETNETKPSMRFVRSATSTSTSSAVALRTGQSELWQLQKADVGKARRLTGVSH